MDLELDKQPLIQTSLNSQSQETIVSENIIKFSYSGKISSFQNVQSSESAAIVILILGFFVSLIWLGGLIFITSKNKKAMCYGIASLVLFSISLTFFILILTGKITF